MGLKHFQKLLRINNINSALFINTHSTRQDTDIRYFSNYPSFGALIIPSKGKPKLLTPLMEYDRAKKLCYKNIKIIKWQKTPLFEAISKAIPKKCKTIGIDKNKITLNEFKALKKYCKFKYKDISNLATKTRVIKTDEEIKIIKAACKLTDKILQSCINSFKKFKTESDAAAHLESETKRAGYQLSFPPIIASGKNSKFPHHTPLKNKITKGFCIIDFGIIYKGYCTDITRTVYIGTPSISETKSYNKVLRAADLAINNLKPGIKCSDIDKITRDLLGKTFTHSLGHGIGIDVHELPNLGPKSTDTLQNNMIFTIEPGSYNRYGIRIEDDILLINNKPVLLTKTKRSLIIIK